MARRSSLIAAVFGLVYVLANARELAAAPDVTLSVVAIALFLGVLVALRRAATRSTGTAPDTRGAGFGRAYRLVIVCELVALTVGLVVVTGPLHTGRAAVAWVSVVVGVHFYALAAIWHRRELNLLGGFITACGVVGLGLAFLGTGVGIAPIAVLSGVVPGLLLLVAAAGGARRQLAGR